MRFNPDGHYLIDTQVQGDISVEGSLNTISIVLLVVVTIPRAYTGMGVLLVSST